MVSKAAIPIVACVVAGCLQSYESPALQPDAGAGGREGWDNLACEPLPSDLATVANESLDTGAPYHWSLAEGCIPVSYEPDLVEFAGDLRRAVDIWNSVSCSRLRLCAPEQASLDLSFWYTAGEVPEDAHRIHVTDEDLAGNSDLDPYLRDWVAQLTHVLTNRPYGRILFSAIQLQLAEARLLMVPAHWTRALGQAVGLAGSSDPSSIMERAKYSEIADPTNAILSDADITTICTLYGDPPYCPEPAPH